MSKSILLYPQYRLDTAAIRVERDREGRIREASLYIHEPGCIAGDGAWIPSSDVYINDLTALRRLRDLLLDANLGESEVSA